MSVFLAHTKNLYGKMMSGKIKLKSISLKANTHREKCRLNEKKKKNVLHIPKIHPKNF